LDGSIACHTSTFFLRPDVPGFIPAIGFVGISTMVDADDVDASNLMELPQVDRWNAPLCFGTKASMEADDETKAIHATAIIVNFIFLVYRKVPVWCDYRSSDK
jgi:hypothetical protein